MNKEILLSATDKRNLLLLARNILKSYLLDDRSISKTMPGIELTDAIKKKAGVFVTLTKNNQLRGCIGEILPTREIYLAVMDRSIDSAIHDPRFTPVNVSELEEIDIEISVLTPPQKIASYQEIILGVHGIILSKNYRSAVFLPQVATEQEWDLTTTLTHLSLKAKMGSNGWREGANFEVFEAIVFHE